MKVSGSDPTRRSRGGRRHSGAPGGGVPARHEGAFYEVPDQDVAPIGAPLPHMCEGKGNDGGPHADQIMGAMTHVCCLTTESESCRHEPERLSRPIGDPGEIRTPNLWNRNPLLYPVELRGRRGLETGHAAEL